MGIKSGFVKIDRRAIRTDDLVIRTHVQIHMGMIEGRTGAHAIELPYTDMDFLGANIIAKVWNRILGHMSLKNRCHAKDDCLSNAIH